MRRICNPYTAGKICRKKKRDDSWEEKFPLGPEEGYETSEPPEEKGPHSSLSKISARSGMRKKSFPFLCLLPLISFLAAGGGFLFFPARLPGGQEGIFPPANKLLFFLWPLSISLTAWGIQMLAGRLLRAHFPLFPRLSLILAWGISGILLLLQLQRLYTLLFPGAYGFSAEHAALLGLVLFTTSLGIYVVFVISGKKA